MNFSGILPFLLLLLLLAPDSFARATEPCEGRPLDLLILGDSQTGGSWATSYFGDFLQACLARKTGLRFAAYARGGTQMIQWTGNASLDSIPTVYRDETIPHRILGKSEVPLCQKRLRPLLQAHQPKAVLLQFGDNLLRLSAGEIEGQTEEILNELDAASEAAGLARPECFFATPTWEMAVKTKRNVPGKNLANTRKVTEAIERASRGRCRVWSGLDLLQGSALLQGETLRRIPVEGTRGCTGGAENDNTHTCGEAARAWAEAICRQL